MKKGRAFLNLFIVWLLTGAWHGASWNFILWGLYFFIILVFEKNVFKKILKEPDTVKWYKKILLHCYSIILILFGWVLFRAQNISGIMEYFKALFGLNGLPLIDSTCIHYFASKYIYYVLAIVFTFPVYRRLDRILNKSKICSLIINPIVMECILIVSISFLVKGTYNPFIYFNF